MLNEINELRQSVIDATGRMISAILVYLVPGATALASFFDKIEPIIAGVTMILTLVMACLHFKRRDKLMATKDRLMITEIEWREAQIESINERKEKREEKHPDA